MIVAGVFLLIGFGMGIVALGNLMVDQYDCGNLSVRDPGGSGNGDCLGRNEPMEQEKMSARVVVSEWARHKIAQLQVTLENGNLEMAEKIFQEIRETGLLDNSKALPSVTEMISDSDLIDERILNALDRAGIQTWEDLGKMTRVQLLRTRGIGVGGANLLMKLMAQVVGVDPPAEIDRYEANLIYDSTRKDKKRESTDSKDG